MYLVTGGAGFIGSNIVRALNDRGVSDIFVVDDLSGGKNFLNLCDCTISDYMDRGEFRDALREGRLKGAFKYISHQGACSDTMEQDGRYMMDNNFTFSKELLHYALDEGIPMVYASSAAVYGNKSSFSEDPVNEAPLNVYGYSKLAFDQYVRRFLPDVKNTLAGLRYFNVYGPRERHKGRMSSMVYQLFNQFRDNGFAKLFQGSGGYGDGEQERDFVYVGDVAEVNLHLLHTDKPVHGIFNVGTGKARSFNDIAHTLMSSFDGARIEYVPMPESIRGKYQNFTEADISRLRAAGYRRDMTSLEDGIGACVPWWQQEAP